MSPTRTESARASKPGSFTPTAADRETATLARALGHPVRVAILRLLLARGECVCGVIVNEMPLAQSTVSQHLKVLKAAGLVDGEVDGPRVCYCASAKAVKRVKELIGALQAP